MNTLGGVNPLRAGVDDGEIKHSSSCCGGQRGAKACRLEILVRRYDSFNQNAHVTVGEVAMAPVAKAS